MGKGKRTAKGKAELKHRREGSSKWPGGSDRGTLPVPLEIGHEREEGIFWTRGGRGTDDRAKIAGESQREFDAMVKKGRMASIKRKYPKEKGPTA